MASATVNISSTTTTTTKVSPNIRFDPQFIKSIPGILKIVEVVLCLVGFICVQMVAYHYITSASGWYIFVAMTGFWVTLIVFLGYLFHIVEKLHWIPWLMLEMGFAVVWAVLFFIAACVVVAKSGEDPGWGAAAFFGFAAVGVFGYDGFIKYKAWKSGEIAQGERTTATTSPTGPSYPTY